MAKKKTRAQKKKQQEKTTYLIIGLSFILFAIFGALKLGFLGVLMANVFRFIAGDLYQIAAVILGLYGVLILFMGKDPKFKRASIWIGGLVFFLGLLLFLHIRLFNGMAGKQLNIVSITWQKLFADIANNAVSQSVGGGMTGAVLYSATHYLVARLGSYLIAFLAMAAGIMLMFNIGISQVLDRLKKIIQSLVSLIRSSNEKRAEKKKQRQAEQAEKQQKLADQKTKTSAKNDVRPLTEGEQLAKSEAASANPGQDGPEQLTLEIDSYQSRTQSPKEPLADNTDDDNNLSFAIQEEAENRDYVLPPSTLLNDIPPSDQSKEYSLVEKKVGILERTFESFGVDAKVVRASLGPSVTKFEVQPAVGVKVSKIVNLSDDLALALAAKDIRMEAPIPGKSLIGIEVPNSSTSTVSFRDIIESQEEHPDRLLEVPLGRSISGAVISADLAKMPHLLIAGSTGSGKSVCINGIICSLLMRAKPHEVKLMMIDPKMVELNVYNGIPHLLTPVVTNPRKAAQALQKVVEEMELRYEKFAGFGVRNITGYNEMIVQNNLTSGKNDPTMPFIVVIVDELADLMMVASNEVEDAIIRLAQMARAAGIHMILATQRPSVDVITGIIKANVPSRIAFAVSSGTDSRTIIDSNGAEKLLGRGDMLFLPMGENKPIRVQGAFISDQEVEQVVEFVKSQQEADYQEHMMPTEEVGAGAADSSQDEYYQDALELVVEMQTASVSLLQRRFRIGYNRAARLVDDLEANGIVGPSEGSKPRKVLIEELPSASQDNAPPIEE